MANDTDNIGVNHPEYNGMLANWQLVDDMVNSENQKNYLIRQYPGDASPENSQRNIDYQDRASWLGVSGFTLSGLIGTAYGKAPVIDLPKSLEYMRVNVDGSNVGLNQQIQSTTRAVLKQGRAGLFTTYPDTGGNPVSMAEQESLKYVPTIHLIDARRIVNWDYVKIGAESVLSLLVFTDIKSTGGRYGRKPIPVRRELALLAGDAGAMVFQDSTWVQSEKKEWVLFSEPVYPTRGDGSNWDRIPFAFVGAVDNNAEIDKAPMLDIATKNRDHFRNSADHEESVYFCGQAQPWASGLDVDTFKEMKEVGLYVGSRKMLGLPDGASFAFAVSPPNTMVRQAMLDKIEDMVGMGARLIKQGTVAKTAAQAIGENAVQHSILSLAVENVASAYQVALGWAAIYQNQPADILVVPDKGFMTTPITAQDLQAFKDLVLVGVLSEDDQHRYLTKHDIIDPEKPLEEWQAEINAGGGIGGPE